MKKSELREMIKEEMIREGDDIEDIIKDSEVKLKMILKKRNMKLTQMFNHVYPKEIL